MTIRIVLGLGATDLVSALKKTHFLVTEQGVLANSSYSGKPVFLKGGPTLLRYTQKEVICQTE